MDYCPQSVSQALLASVPVESQCVWVDAHQVENRGMHVMYADCILDRFVAQFIKLSKTGARFDAATRHPHGKAKWIVVATGAIL